MSMGKEVILDNNCILYEQPLGFYPSEVYFDEQRLGFYYSEVYFDEQHLGFYHSEVYFRCKKERFLYKEIRKMKNSYQNLNSCYRYNLKDSI